MLDVQDIWKLLPHRYPFLLVDRVLEMPSERVDRCAQKCNGE